MSKKGESWENLIGEKRRKNFLFSFIHEILDEEQNETQRNNEEKDKKSMIELAFVHLHFLIEVSKSRVLALVNLNKIATAFGNLPIPSEIYLHKVKLLLEEEFPQQSLQADKLCEAINFDKDLNATFILYEACVREKLEFICMLSSDFIDLQKLKSLSTSLLHKKNKLLSQILRLARISSNNPVLSNIIYGFGLHFSIVADQNTQKYEFCNDVFLPSVMKEYLQKQKNDGFTLLADEAVLDNLRNLSENSCILQMGLRGQKLGKVLKVQNSFYKMFEFKTKIIDSIDEIIPASIAKNHQLFLQEYLVSFDSAGSRNNGKFFNLLIALSQRGWGIPIKMQFQIVQMHLHQDIEFIAVIRQVKSIHIFALFEAISSKILLGQENFFETFFLKLISQKHLQQVYLSRLIPLLLAGPSVLKKYTEDFHQTTIFVPRNNQPLHVNQLRHPLKISDFHEFFDGISFRTHWIYSLKFKINLTQNKYLNQGIIEIAQHAQLETAYEIVNALKHFQTQMAEALGVEIEFKERFFDEDDDGYSSDSSSSQDHSLKKLKLKDNNSPRTLDFEDINYFNQKRSSRRIAQDAFLGQQTLSRELITQQQLPQVSDTPSQQKRNSENSLKRVESPYQNIMSIESQTKESSRKRQEDLKIFKNDQVDAIFSGESDNQLIKTNQIDMFYECTTDFKKQESYAGTLDLNSSGYKKQTKNNNNKQTEKMVMSFSSQLKNIKGDNKENQVSLEKYNLLDDELNVMLRKQSDKLKTNEGKQSAKRRANMLTPIKQSNSNNKFVQNITSETPRDSRFKQSTKQKELAQEGDQSSKNNSIATGAQKDRFRFASKLATLQIPLRFYWLKYLGFIGVCALLGQTLYQSLQVDNQFTLEKQHFKNLAWPMEMRICFTLPLYYVQQIRLYSFNLFTGDDWKAFSELNTLRIQNVETLFKLLYKIFLDADKNDFPYFQNATIYHMAYVQVKDFQTYNSLVTVGQHTSLQYFFPLLFGSIRRYFEVIPNTKYEEAMRDENFPFLMTPISQFQDNIEAETLSVLSSIESSVFISMIIQFILSFIILVSAFPIYAMVQQQTENILKLFSTFAPENINLILQNLIATQQEIQQLKACIYNSKGLSSSNPNAAKQHLLNLQNNKRKTLSHTTNLPKISMKISLACLLTFCLICIQPIVNSVLIKSLTSEQRVNLSLLKNMYSLKANLASNLYLGMANILEKTCDTCEFYDHTYFQRRIPVFFQENKDTMNKFDVIAREATKTSRYKQQLYDEFFFKLIQSNLCEALSNFPEYINDPNFSLDISSCESIIDGLLTKGFQISAQYLMNQFPKLYELTQSSDLNQVKANILSWENDINLLKFDEFTNIILVSISAIKDFMISISDEYLTYVSTVEFYLLGFYCLVILFAIFFIGFQFHRFVLVSLKESLQFFSLLDLFSLQANIYISNFLKCYRR